MNGLMNFIKDNFSAFVNAMLIIPSELQVQSVGEAAVLVIILVVALAAIFLSARWMKKHNLGFTASVLLTFLVLSLTLGLMGFFLSILRLDLITSAPFFIFGIGFASFTPLLTC